jgi:hypothetical protein
LAPPHYRGLANSTGRTHKGTRVFKTLKHNVPIDDVRRTAKGHLRNRGNDDWSVGASKRQAPPAQGAEGCFPMNQNTEVEPAVELRRVPLAAIKIDPAIQQRVAGTSQEVVDDYACAMRDGDAFPPPIVFSDDGVNYCLVDGYHRFDAYRLAHPEVQKIECEVHTGDHDDALIWACGANTRHCLRRTGLDKLKAVITLLRIDRCSDWSDRRVAEHCGVSHPFVAKVRREHVEKLPDTGRKDEDQARRAPAASDGRPAIPEDRRRTVKRGDQLYPMRTARIGRVRATLSRPKNAEAKPLLTSLAWSTATKPDRVKFVSAVGGREIVEALRSIEPGFDILGWAWKTVGQAEREQFAKRHDEEIHRLANGPGPATAVESLFDADDARSLRELKTDNDRLAIPTFLRRAKVQSHDPSGPQ